MGAGEFKKVCLSVSASVRMCVCVSVHLRYKVK